MKKTVLLLVLCVVSLLKVVGQSFTVHDVLVSSPYANLGDVEFDVYKNRICWQDPLEHNLWICKLDTLTWSLAVPDGKQTLVDSNLTALSQTNNSAEWGYDMWGTYLVYNKSHARKKFVGVAMELSTGWSTSVLLDAPHRMNPHATQNPTDSNFAIQYISTIWNNYTKYKIMNDPYHEKWIQGFTDAHWVADEMCMTGILDNNQVGYVNLADPNNIISLTHNFTKHYTKPYMWHAPEFNNARMFFAVANGEEMQIFKETTPASNHFALYLSFTTPSSNPLYIKFGSPEPYVYEGQSYITFMASSSECETSCFPGEIWLVKVDSLNPMFRMISNSYISIRTDPEFMPTKDSLLVYYTEVNDTIAPASVYRLRKCDTGIGKNFTTSTNDLTQNTPNWRIYPNPFNDRIQIANQKGDELFMLTDPVGRPVWSGISVNTTDFSALPKGVYFLTIQSKRSSKQFKVVKN